MVKNQVGYRRKAVFSIPENNRIRELKIIVYVKLLCKPFGQQKCLKCAIKTNGILLESGELT